MRTITSEQITNAVKDMCIEVNHVLAPDMKEVLYKASDAETNPVGKEVLSQLKENLEIAAAERIPI